MKKYVSIFYIFLMTCLMTCAGCGFHLRQPISAEVNLPAIQITSQLKDPQQLSIIRQYLLRAGFTLVDNAATILNLQSMTTETRNYTYTNRAKVAEYQLIRTLNYQLFDANQKPLSPVLHIYKERIYPIDQQNISGNAQEGALIHQELQDAILKQLSEQLNQTVKYIHHSSH